MSYSDLLSTVPRTATPIVALTCRIALISPDPEPLRSAEIAPIAALLAAGLASQDPGRPP
jgi:hypothetical protein